MVTFQPTGIADKRKNHKNLSLNLPRRIETPRKPCDPPSQEPQHLTHYEHGPAQILPNLFLGACHTAQRKDVLERHGISCILNVAHEINLTPPPGSSYHHLKWTHTQNNLARREFHRAIRVLEAARQSDTNVLVHCQSGVERSATLIIAYILYLSRKQPALIGKRLTLSEAYDYVRTRAPAIRPNMELMYQLNEFELMAFPKTVRPRASSVNHKNSANPQLRRRAASFVSPQRQPPSLPLPAPNPATPLAETSSPSITAPVLLQDDEVHTVLIVMVVVFHIVMVASTVRPKPQQRAIERKASWIGEPSTPFSPLFLHRLFPIY